MLSTSICYSALCHGLHLLPLHLINEREHNAIEVLHIELVLGWQEEKIMRDLCKCFNGSEGNLLPLRTYQQQLEVGYGEKQVYGPGHESRLHAETSSLILAVPSF